LPSCGTKVPDKPAFPKSTRMTLLSGLQVTWNQVQGLTRVGSQLWRTLLESFSASFQAWSASPSELAVAKLKPHKNSNRRSCHLIRCMAVLPMKDITRLLLRSCSDSSSPVTTPNSYSCCCFFSYPYSRSVLPSSCSTSLLHQPSSSTRIRLLLKLLLANQCYKVHVKPKQEK
jgi:hypothetical protein